MRERIINIRSDFSHSTSSLNKGLLFIILSNIALGLSNFSIKLIMKKFEEDFDAYSFNLWRNSVFIIIGYVLIIQNNEEIFQIQKLNAKFWFFVQASSNFITMISFVYAVGYIRAATAQNINLMNPIMIIILSYFILQERFHIRYVIGITICLCGTLMIAFNDRKYMMEECVKRYAETDQIVDISFGVFCAFVSMVGIALVIVSNKALVNENISTNNQILCLGLSNAIASLFFIFMEMRINISINFILCSWTSGFLMLLGMIYQVKALEYVDISRVSPYSYFSTLIVFLMGKIFIGEAVYITDIIASLLILSFNVYNAFFPVKSG